MKDCCKTGDELPPPRWKKVATRVLWLVVLAIVLGDAATQLFDLSSVFAQG